MDWYDYENPPFVPTSLVEPRVMEVEREEHVYHSIFPCKDFLRAVGILFSELVGLFMSLIIIFDAWFSSLIVPIVSPMKFVL